MNQNDRRDDLMVINETLKTLKQRRSIRSYKDEQIKEEELQAILEAGLYAPNAGDQAWHFTVVQNKELLNRLNLTAKQSANQLGIEQLKELANDEKFNCLYDAPTLIIISGNEQTVSPEVDCAAATQNLLLAAESMGLGSCWIFFVLLAFYSSERSNLLNELKIPQGYKPYTAAVLGYKKNAVINVPDRKPNLITYIR